MILVGSSLAAIIAAAAWRPAQALLTRTRPGWLVVLTPAVLAAAIAATTIGLYTGAVATVAVCVWAAGSAWLMVIDVAEHRLPLQLSLPLAAVVVALLGVQATLDRTAAAWGRSLVAVVLVALVLFGLAWWAGGRLGLGDVALGLSIAALLGWLGWSQLFYGVSTGFVVGAVSAAAALLAGRGRGSEIAFGPSMVAGAISGAWFAVWVS